MPLLQLNFGKSSPQSVGLKPPSKRDSKTSTRFWLKGFSILFGRILRLGNFSPPSRNKSQNTEGTEKHREKNRKFGVRGLVTAFTDSDLSLLFKTGGAVTSPRREKRRPVAALQIRKFHSVCSRRLPFLNKK